MRLLIKDFLVHLQEYQRTQEAYGVDWNGPLPDVVDDSVAVPETHCPLSDTDLDELKATIDPLAPSDSYGLDLFCSCKEFVATHM